MTSVLVVDDDAEALKSTAMLIRTCPRFAPSTASTAMEALHLCREISFGAVVADLVLPDISGLELLKKLRAEGNMTPFVIVTGFGSIGSVIDALRLGASDYLRKPYFPEELINALEVALWTRDANPSTSGNDSLATFGPLEHRNSESVGDVRVKELIQLIERSPGSPGRIPLMASRVGLSHSRLREVFKADVGMSLSQFRSQKRMGEAARLLVQTLKRISEIAYEVGMEPTSFSRLFRRKFGQSPRDYRNTRRGK
jgi:YesN/AraC family two-component response regulator